MTGLVIGTGLAPLAEGTSRLPSFPAAPLAAGEPTDVGSGFGRMLSRVEDEAASSDESPPREPESHALPPDLVPTKEAESALAAAIAGTGLEPSTGVERDQTATEARLETGTSDVLSRHTRPGRAMALAESVETSGRPPLPATSSGEAEHPANSTSSTEVLGATQEAEPAAGPPMPAPTALALRASALNAGLPDAAFPASNTPGSEVSSATPIEPLEFMGEVLRADELGAELEVGEGRERLHLAITTRDGAVKVQAAGASAELGALLLAYRDQLSVALEAQGLALSSFDFRELDGQSDGAREGEDPSDPQPDDVGPERSRDRTRARTKLSFGRGRIIA